MSVPDWWTLALLGLAAYRIYRLLAMDTILDIPRAWLVGLGGWREGQATPSGYRQGLAEFLLCPWCLGAHVSWVLWLCWEWQPHLTLVACTPFALSAVVGFLSALDKGE